MHAEILTIGDELCRGEIVDTNSTTLAALLWDLGITPRWLTSCNDDPEDLANAIRTAAGRADLVVCSGGLGPTEDDLTVDVTSALAGVTPVIDEPSRAKLEAWFARVGRDRGGRAGAGALGGAALAEIQLRQVRVPTGARVHHNPAGLAPGFELTIGGATVFCLPGFPREIAAILEGGMRARFAELAAARGAGERVARRIYRAFGRGESQLSQSCRGIVDAIPGASIHYQVKFPEVLVKLVARGADADAQLAAMDAEVHARLAGPLYAIGDGETLIERVVRRLIASRATVATAESCTGGLIGELITRVPGSSAVFPGGAIVYANAEKVRQLGVSADTLASHGAVSEATVREMALGARTRFQTDYAVAVSGIAGPDGGTPDKPVGTVWIALARPDGEVATRLVQFPGSRDQNRTLAAWWALALVDAAVALAHPGAIDGGDDVFDRHAGWRFARGGS